MKGIFLSLMIFSLYNCNSIYIDEICGKYVNAYQKDAIHYIELKSDSTYIHYYKKDDDIAKICSGVWSMFSNRNQHEIILKNWIDYGFVDESSCDKCIRFVKIEDNTLMFDFDLTDEKNFSKQFDN